MYACIHEVEGGHIEAIAWFPIVSHPRILNSLENPTHTFFYKMMIASVLRLPAAPKYMARSASAQTMTVFNELSEQVPELFPAKGGPSPKAEVSTLSNGIRVVSLDDGSHVASVGAFVEAGSRHEVCSVEGAAHMLKHLGFKATTKRSALRLYRDMEDAGITSSTTSDREHVVYRADCLRDNALTALTVIGETMTQPYFPIYELLETRSMVNHDHSEQQNNGHALVDELVHATAYGRRSALGVTDVSNGQTVAGVDADALRNYQSNTFTGGRIVVAATGVDHNTLVQSAEDIFSSIAAGEGGATATPAYTGGHAVASAATDACHVAIALDTGTGGFKSKSETQILSSLALETMLGGGVSSSNARLSTSVTEDRFGSGSGASAFGSTYADAGLVGVFGTASGSEVDSLVKTLCKELKNASASSPKAAEVSRAKNQLKASVALNLSTRGGVLSDLGTQVLSTGTVQTPEELFAKIDALTGSDIQSAATLALKSKPTVVAVGNVDNVPSYSAVEAMLK